MDCTFLITSALKFKFCANALFMLWSKFVSVISYVITFRGAPQGHVAQC